MKRAFEENTREAAIAYAKAVLLNARDIGIDVDPMKERMARWITYLESYERDVADIEAGATLSDDENHGLLVTMRRARESVRREIFP